MNTYMVEVNAKFLVKLEIEGSCAAAEHYFLDGYKACWAANAYDEKGMKTECFRGALLTSELVSLKELDQIFKTVDEAGNRAQELEKSMKALENKLAQIQEQYDAVRDEYLSMNTKWIEARHALEVAEEEASTDR